MNCHFYKLVMILIGLAILLLSIQAPPAFAAAPTTDPFIRLQDALRSHSLTHHWWLGSLKRRPITSRM